MNKFITASAFVVALGLSTSALASGLPDRSRPGAFRDRVWLRAVLPKL